MGEFGHRARHVIGRGDEQPAFAGLGIRDGLAEAGVLHRVARAVVDRDAAARDAKAVEQAQCQVGFIGALEHELAHELPKEIKRAVALGDLSENAEYHMAKQRQEFVNARLGQLKKRMSELALVNLTNIPKDRVAFGSRVRVFDNSKEEEIEYKLVTSEESDVTRGLISTTSPIGKALMGKKVGDTALAVTPNGRREMEILTLTTIHDEAE